MLMKVTLQTEAFRYEGAHQNGAGREGTVLEFSIVLEPTLKPAGPGDFVLEKRDGQLWRARVDVHNCAKERATPTDPAAYQAQAFGRNPIETMAKLADNLRRVADALDKSLDEGILVPVRLHRKTPSGEPGDEPLDEVLAAGGS